MLLLLIFLNLFYLSVSGFSAVFFIGVTRYFNRFQIQQNKFFIRRLKLLIFILCKSHGVDSLLTSIWLDSSRCYLSGWVSGICQKSYFVRNFMGIKTLAGYETWSLKMASIKQFFVNLKVTNHFQFRQSILDGFKHPRLKAIIDVGTGRKSTRSEPRSMGLKTLI